MTRRNATAYAARRAPRLLLATVLIAVLAVVAGCTGNKAPTVSSNAGTGSPTPVAGVAADLQPFYMQRLVWKGCGSAFQCSTLTVPMDYEHPGVKSLQLALIRLPASDQGKRIGSLVINPGGPGGSGVDYARAATQVISDKVRKRYDIVGFDPRGVGRSDPVQCLSSTETDAFLAVDPTPTTPEQIAAFIGQSKGLAEKCASRVGDELKFIGTRNAARDLDVLRAALGDAKLYYLGKSYGTYLGTTYADEFPTHIGRMVIDGVIDPALTSEQVNVGQAEGFELATRSFMADCVQRSSCPMGSEVDAGMAALRSLVSGLSAKPLTTKDSRRPLTEGWGTLGVAYAMYSKRLWPSLRDALSAARLGDGQPLLTLADGYARRGSDGRYQGNTNDALYAVNCVDRPQTGGLKQVEQDASAFAQQSPTWGPLLAWGALPCVYWPDQTKEQPKPVTAPGSGPILVVGTIRDPATPYVWAKSTAAELQDGHLLTYDGDGHTAYREGSSCVDTVVDDYLLAGKVPADGKRC